LGVHGKPTLVIDVNTLVPLEIPLFMLHEHLAPSSRNL
jgi:hypothetical protein